MRRWTTLAVLLVTLALGGARAVADQTDARLDGLFDQLLAAGSDTAAAPVEAQIWEIWLHSDDQHVTELMARGVASLNTGDFPHALEAFDAVVAAAPKFAEGWNKRATTLYLMGRLDESERDIDRVLALEPRHFGALSGLGLCQAQSHNERAALDAFERALRVDPHLPGARENAEALRKQIARDSI